MNDDDAILDTLGTITAAILILMGIFIAIFL